MAAGTKIRAAAVALLAEGVDRNFDQIIYNVDGEMSPSSRRAWIEIFCARP